MPGSSTTPRSWRWTPAQVASAGTAAERFAADDVVLACGIWGPALAGLDLPLVPVEHPYVYGPSRGPAGCPPARMPFVRWPERHVYARDHGDRLGLGSYDHAPLPLDSAALEGGAERAFRAEVFDPAIIAALDLLPVRSRFVPRRRLNGVFAMTPDNLPLLGPVGGLAGLWVAEALWVTHAGGAAAALAAMMTGREPAVVRSGRAACAAVPRPTSRRAA